MTAKLVLQFLTKILDLLEYTGAKRDHKKAQEEHREIEKDPGGWFKNHFK